MFGPGSASARTSALHQAALNTCDAPIAQRCFPEARVFFGFPNSRSIAVRNGTSDVTSSRQIQGYTDWWTFSQREFTKRGIEVLSMLKARPYFRRRRKQRPAWNLPRSDCAWRWSHRPESDTSARLILRPLTLNLPLRGFLSHSPEIYNMTSRSSTTNEWTRIIKMSCWKSIYTMSPIDLQPRRKSLKSRKISAKNSGDWDSNGVMQSTESSAPRSAQDHYKTKELEWCDEWLRRRFQRIFHDLSIHSMSVLFR